MIRLSFLLVCLCLGLPAGAEEIMGVLSSAEMGLLQQMADHYRIPALKRQSCIKREFMLESRAKDLGVTEWMVRSPLPREVDRAHALELNKIALRLQIPTKDVDLITRKRLIRAIEDSCGQRPPWYLVYETPEEDEYSGPAVSRSGDRLVVPSEDGAH